jgi:2-iminobutanoate/2-iminopropanoate deaminase
MEETSRSREGTPPPQGPYSLSTAWRDLVFVSGLVAVRGDGSKVEGDVREETMVVLRNLERVLRERGSGLDKVLRVDVLLVDLEHLQAFNEVYEEFFSPPYPARTVAGVSLPGSFRVEVSAVAHT